MSNPQTNINAYDESDLIASTSNPNLNQTDLGASTPPTGSNTAEAAGKKGIAKLIADGTFQTTKRKAGRADIVKKTMGPIHGSWVWDIACQLPMDITRLKDGLLRWVLSSLYKAHPERMIWFYGKLLDGFVADEYRMRHRNVRFFAECPNTVVIALIVAEIDNDLANYGVYGDCYHSAAKTDFQALYAILNAEVQNLPRSAGSDRMDEIKKTWTPSEDHNLIVDITLCPNPADVVQMNRRNIFRQAITGETTGISGRAELLGGIIMHKEIFWDRLGDGHISFAVQFQTPDLLNFVWRTLSATQPRIRDLLMAKIDQLITSRAEPKQWLEMFSRSPHLISMLVILHQSGTLTLNQIDYLDDPRILPSLDLRDFEVMWQVIQAELQQYCGTVALPWLFPNRGRALKMLIEHNRQLIAYEFVHPPA